MARAAKKRAVYRILNTVSGSYYIGSSSNLYERWRTHRNKLRAGTHPNPKLQASWVKHGESAFVFLVVAEFQDIGDMEVCEEALLMDSAADPHCCNLSTSAKTPWRNCGPKHHNYGKPMSEEQKQKLRDAAARQWGRADPRTGRKHSEETKRKISAKAKAVVAEGRGGKFIPSEETRAKMSEALKGNQNAKGHVRTEEHRRKLSEANKGNRNWLGKTHSQESRAKMGRAVVAVDPEGAETMYSTVSAFRETFGLNPPTANRALKSGKPISRGAMAGWSLRYV